MRRLVYLMVLVFCVAFAWSGYAAGNNVEIGMVDKFDKIQTSAVMASRPSVENVLYNSVFNYKIVWESMSRDERLSLIDKTQSAIVSGLGVKIHIKKVEKLKNVELQILPFNPGGHQILIVATNFKATKTGFETTSIDKGNITLFKMDGEHLALCNFPDPPQELLDQIDQQIQKDPKNLDLRLYKANLYDSYDQRAAITEYEKIIQDFPDSAAAYNNLAMIYTGYYNLNLLDPDKALFNALKACELTQNKDVGHLDTLARAYYVKGDYAKALELEQSNSKLTDNIDVQAFLEILETHAPVNGKSV